MSRQLPTAAGVTRSHGRNFCYGMRRLLPSRLARCNLVRLCARLLSELGRGRLVLALLATVLLLRQDWLSLTGHLLSVPYSQFSYPLETDFRRLVADFKATGRAPAWAPAAINDQKFPTLHTNSRRCKQKQYRLLILVKSSVGNLQFRDAIRQTWVQQRHFGSDFPTQHAFVLGAASSSSLQAIIDEEQRLHGDIVQQAFKDAYFNNTLKTMFAFSWAVQYCPNAEFVLFVDDDYYISPRNMRSFLLNRRDSDQSIVGFVFQRPVPKRLVFSKWYTPLSEYPYAYWPPYPTGGALVVSRSLCRSISIAQKFVKYLRFDDVFIGIVLKKLGVQPEHHGLFYYEQPLPVARWQYANALAVHLDRNVHELLHVWRVMNYSVGNG